MPSEPVLPGSMTSGHLLPFFEPPERSHLRKGLGMSRFGGPGLREGGGLQAPFLPPLPVGQEGHPASHTSSTFEGSHAQTGGTLCAQAKWQVQRSIRGQAGRDWERKGGSESSAVLPIPCRPPGGN